MNKYKHLFNLKRENKELVIFAQLRYKDEYKL